MLNSLSVKQEHRRNLIKVNDIDILGISRSTDDIFIRYIDVTKFCESKYTTIIEFYGISLGVDKFIYSPLFSNKPITYDEFKSSVAHLIISGIIKKLPGVSITSKGNGFVNLSNGALVGIGNKRFIRDNHNRFYYGKDCESLLDLISAFNFYIAYVKHFRKSKITNSVRSFFNGCLDRIDSICTGVRIEWEDTLIEKGQMKWAFSVKFGGFIKRFKFYVEQFNGGLIARTECGKYKEAYEALEELVGILKEYIDEREKLAGIYPEKFIAILDVIRHYVGDGNINDVELSYCTKNKEYSSLLLLNKCNINICSDTSNKIYVECSYDGGTYSKGIAKNKNLEIIRSQAMTFITEAMSRVENYKPSLKA